MLEINEQPQAVEEEGQAPITPKEETPTDEVVTLPKAEFNKMNRKAFAYDAIKKNTPPIPKEADPEIVTRLSNIELIEAKRQFGYENNLSPKEVDYIFKHSQGKPTKELLEDPFVQGGLEKLRQTERVSSNTPSSTSKGFMASGKDFKDMTPAEQKAAYEAKMKGM